MPIPIRILIVEDDENDAMLLINQLEFNNYAVESRRVQTREDMAAALREFKWDLVISDYRMPNFSAEAALKTLKESAIDIPFIISSGTIGEDAAVNALKAGANDFIVKGKFARLIPAIEREMKDAETRREQTRTRQQLARSEHFLDRINELIPDLLYLYDLDSDRMIYGNRQFRQFLGVTEAGVLEVTRERMETFLHPGDYEMITTRRQRFPHLKDNELLESEFRFRNAGGEWRWLRTRETVFSRGADGKPAVMLGVSFDITDRRKAEDDLRSSEGRNRAILKALPDAIFHLTADGIVLDYQAPAGFVLLASPETLLGSSIHTILPADIVEDLLLHIDHALSTGSVDTFEYGLTKAGIASDFEARIVAIAGNEALVIVRDVTARKDSEQKLREQAALLDISRNAIIVCTVEGKITYWNSGASALYGWKPEEAISASFFELLEPQSMNVRSTAFDSARRIGAWNGELTLTAKDSHAVVVQATETLMRDHAGKPKSILIIHTDLTEFRNLEKQVLRSQRMESIGTLAGGIAHDLNNVLAPIIMSLEILRRRISDAEGTRVLESLQASARRGVDMVKQVLTFARGVQGDRIILSPQYLIEEMVKIAGETFPKSIEIRKNVPKDLLPVSGDPTQLHQVLLNLCINARDAMPDGGRITLIAKNMQVDDSYARVHIDAKKGPYVCIDVTDTGTGIPPEIIEKIFDPFFTTKDPGKGTGLGLSTTMAIVKNHGGFLTVYSEPGHGTTFKVYLPVVSDAAAIPQPEKELNLPIGSGQTVLVVDDEAAIREMTKTMLETCGYAVLTASDGTEALAVFVQHKQEIDILLTDLMMPYMDGLSLVRAIRKIEPGIKIIATSGLGMREDDRKLSDLDIARFLPKPYTAERLLNMLDEVLKGK